MAGSQEKQRCGFAAIIGAPNAGKSTLINSIVGGKVSIVSSKVQTTRTRILGIVAEDDTQIIFVDTPGIFKPSERKRMERAIVAAAWEGVSDAELILFVIDSAKGLTNPVRSILDGLKNLDDKKTFILVLNKVDEVARPKLLELATKMNDEFDFEATFMVSAKTGDGVGDLLKHVAKHMPESVWHYPEDQMSDMPMRMLAAEITREKLFRSLHEEIPHDLTVETEKWEEFNDGSIKIDQIIVIARESQKKIVIGKGGAMLGKIGMQSRIELEEILGCRVHLKLFVKVREDWASHDEHYTSWGLDPKA